MHDENQNEPAAPEAPAPKKAPRAKNTKTTPEVKGLSRRDYFAGMAAQGLAASQGASVVPRAITGKAVQIADSLIADLDKSTE